MTKTTLSRDELSRYVSLRVRNPVAADRYWARCVGQDAAPDGETTARIMEFLKGKLSHEDCAKVYLMMDGAGEAMDTEPPPDDPEAKPTGKLAEDAKAGFAAMFPGLAHIKLDNSGIPIPKRPAKPRVAMDAADTKSFFKRYPDAARIKLA